MAVSVNKWFVFIAFTMIISSYDKKPVFYPDKPNQFKNVSHPFHVTVTEVNHNATDKTLEISCKIFTDDFEDALSKKFKVKIDLINPKDKAAMDKYVSAYIHDYLQLKADGKAVTLNYLGYEVENEAVFAYLQVDNISTVKKIEITNSLMYDVFNDQVGINHVTVGGNRKSVQLDYPNNQAVVQF